MGGGGGGGQITYIKKSIRYEMQHLMQIDELLFKGQLQRFHKLSLFDRFRHVENGLDINF